MPPAAPAGLLLFEHAPGGVGEDGNTLDAALVGQRVATGPRQLPVGDDGLLAGFGERVEGDSAIPSVRSVFPAGNLLNRRNRRRPGILVASGQPR